MRSSRDSVPEELHHHLLGSRQSAMPMIAQVVPRQYQSSMMIRLSTGQGRERQQAHGKAALAASFRQQGMQLDVLMLPSPGVMIYAQFVGLGHALAAIAAPSPAR